MSEVVGFSQPYGAILAKIRHLQHDNERHNNALELTQRSSNELSALFALISWSDQVAPLDLTLHCRRDKSSLVRSLKL